MHGGEALAGGSSTKIWTLSRKSNHEKKAGSVGGKGRREGSEGSEQDGRAQGPRGQEQAPHAVKIKNAAQGGGWEAVRSGGRDSSGKSGSDTGLLVHRRRPCTHGEQADTRLATQETIVSKHANSSTSEGLEEPFCFVFLWNSSQCWPFAVSGNHQTHLPEPSTPTAYKADSYI